MRALSVTWWCGVPAVVIGWFLLSHRTIELRPEALYAIGNALSTRSPLAAELMTEYSFGLAAVALAVIVCLWSHRRRTSAIRIESFFLATCVAGLEACVRAVWFARCRGIGSSPAPAELHSELHVAATASAVAMLAPLLAALFLVRWRGAGVSGTRPHVVSTAAATASILLIWAALDTLFFRA